ANALSRCHPERRGRRGDRGVEGPLPCERSLTLSSRATSAARSRGTPTLRTLSHAVIPSDERSEESRDPYPANALSRCHPERRAQRGVEGPLPLRTLSHAVIPIDERSEESRDHYPANALSCCHPERSEES